jgi:hypothetical protein
VRQLQCSAPLLVLLLPTSQVLTLHRHYCCVTAVLQEKGIKKQEWNKTDMQYARGGERANQSVNIFGKGANLPWAGRAGFVSAGAIDPIKEQAKWKRAQSVRSIPHCALLLLQLAEVPLFKHAIGSSLVRTLDCCRKCVCLSYALHAAALANLLSNTLRNYVKSTLKHADIDS